MHGAIVAGNPEALTEARKADSQRGIAILLAGAAGALVGWPLGEAIGGSDSPHWVLAGAGAGFAAIGIPLAISADKHFKRAVACYNGPAAGPEAMRGLDVDVALNLRTVVLIARF